MALQYQISLSSPSSMGMLMPLSPSSAAAASSSSSSTNSTMMMMTRSTSNKSIGMKKNGRSGGLCVVRSSLEMAGPVVGQVTEVSQDTFWPLVNASGDKVVVLDMYTQWCGPCKVMAPKYEELSKKHLDVVFMKLDCNQDNKALAKELGIRVVPTFKILKDGKVVKEVTGAKMDDLIVAIETAKSS